MSIAWSSWPPTDQEMIQKSCWSVAGCPMNGGAEKSLPRVDRWKPSGCHRLQFPGPRAPDRFVLVISCHYCILYIYIYIYMNIWYYLIIFVPCTMRSTSKYLIVSRLCQLAVDKCRQHVEIAEIASCSDWLNCLFFGSMFWLLEIFLHGSLNSTGLFWIFLVFSDYSGEIAMGGPSGWGFHTHNIA